MDLFQQWLDFKQQEELARNNRITVEQQIIDEYGCKDEGSQTHKPDGYKVTITGKVNRTLDAAAWGSVADKVPANLSPVQYKPSLDARGLKYLKSNEPEIYRIVAEAITAKPGKPSVKVEKV